MTYNVFSGTLNPTHFTSIRPVLEHCVLVWHYAMTKAQTQQTKAVQKRAIHIILNFSCGMPYTVMLSAAPWPLAEKKCQGNSSFTFLNPLLGCITFSQIQYRSLGHFWLRTYEKYPRVFTRTKRYFSFTQYTC